MTSKLTKMSLVWTLPLALALATPLARAADQKDTQHKAATKTVTTTKGGNTVAPKATTKEADTVCHSIHDWQPGSLDKQTTSMETTPSVSRRERRRQRVAASERAVEMNP